MYNISKLRDAANILLNNNSLPEAFYTYNEICNLIWTALGNVQTSLNEFAQKFLSFDIRTSINFRSAYIPQVSNTIFIKYFNLDADQVLNEFLFSYYGKIQCYSNIEFDIDEHQILKTDILNDFLVLYGLVLNSTDERWINHTFKFATPIIENNILKKVRYGLTNENLFKYLNSYSERINSTDWAHLNLFLTSFLEKANLTDNHLYNYISSLNIKFNSSNNEKSEDKNYKRYERYEKYEKYVYEEVNYSRHSKPEFDITTATEEEKQKHFGKVLGLKGKVTKSDIRKKYLEAIAQYHPDKVNNLGDELISLAEKKTKEINIAYEWFKEKYNL